jgi:low affinity Fe/Cu permease
VPANRLERGYDERRERERERLDDRPRLDERDRERPDERDLERPDELERLRDDERLFLERELRLGTLPPSRRASESPIAIACLRLFTFLPDRPERSVPCLRSCIAFSTLLEAFLPYLRAKSHLQVVSLQVLDRFSPRWHPRCTGLVGPGPTAGRLRIRRAARRARNRRNRSELERKENSVKRQNSVKRRRASRIARFLEAFSVRVTEWAGSSIAFGIAAMVIVVWAVTGPLFHYSDTWQLVINTGTTIVTFLMVFLIQRAQNKDSRAAQLKLNEIVAALEGASNRLINVEDLSEDEIQVLRRHYAEIARICAGRGDLRESHSIEEAHDRDERKAKRRRSA